MLQAASQRVLGACGSGGALSSLGSMLQRAYSSGAKEDYSLVMKEAFELSTESVSAPLPPGEGGITFGVPLETFKRKAIVMAAARVAGQQGVGNTLANPSAPGWRIEFETRGKWQNPLQGWNSTADPLENVGRSSLFFFTREEAVAYAEKAGWEVEVVEPNLPRKDRQKRFNAYGDNYTVKRNGVPDLSHLTEQAKIPYIKN